MKLNRAGVNVDYLNEGFGALGAIPPPGAPFPPLPDGDGIGTADLALIPDIRGQVYEVGPALFSVRTDSSSMADSVHDYDATFSTIYNLGWEVLTRRQLDSLAMAAQLMADGWGPGVFWEWDRRFHSGIAVATATAGRHAYPLPLRAADTVTIRHDGVEKVGGWTIGGAATAMGGTFGGDVIYYHAGHAPAAGVSIMMDGRGRRRRIVTSAAPFSSQARQGDSGLWMARWALKVDRS
jgi:hypothetical protein